MLGIGSLFVEWMKKIRFESIHRLASSLEIVGHGFNLVTYTLLHLIFITILGNNSMIIPILVKENSNAKQFAQIWSLICKIPRLMHCTCVSAYACVMLRFQLLCLSHSFVWVFGCQSE